jgi:PKD repeat protein
MAIFGNNSLGLAGNTTIAGRNYCSSFVLGAPAVVTELHAWIGQGDPTYRVQLTIYADNGGTPGARLAYTTPLGTVSGDTDIAATGLSISLSAGTYWLGWCGENLGTARVYYDADTVNRHAAISAGAAFNPPVDPYPNPPTNGYGVRIYSVWAVTSNAPVADFSASPTAGGLPLAVNFADLSSNTPTSWLWDFGDSTTSTSQNPSHTYTSSGTYTVALTVTNAAGNNTKTVVGCIRAGVQPSYPFGLGHLASLRTTGSQSGGVPLRGMGGRGAGIGVAPTWISSNAYNDPAARPPFTPGRVRNFTTQAQLESLIGSWQPGDLFVNTNNSGSNINISGEWEALSGLRPAAPGLKFDFGLPADPNCVRWTGTTLHSNLPAVYIHDSSNLQIFGGRVGNVGGSGIHVNGGATAATDNILWYNFIVTNTGNHGLAMFPLNPSGGGTQAANTISNCDFAGECANWGTDYLTLDNHSEKGTGIHGAILADVDTIGYFEHNRVSIDGHDCPIGNVMELGQDGAYRISNNTLLYRARNLTFVATQQTGGNGLVLWGDTPNTNTIVPYAECLNLKGRAVDCNLATTNQFAGVTVVYGRATNCCGNPNLGSLEPGTPANQPWDTRGNVVYQNVA